MNKYAIFQLPEGNPKIRDMYFLEASEIEEISDEYEFVARIDARSLDECFRIGNFVLEEDLSLIEVVGEMHSISVGDIAQDLETGKCFVCQNYGWKEIDMKEAV